MSSSAARCHFFACTDRVPSAVAGSARESDREALPAPLTVRPERQRRLAPPSLPVPPYYLLASTHWAPPRQIRGQVNFMTP